MRKATFDINTEIIPVLTGEKNFRGRFRDTLLPEFRLDETRIVFIAMRKLSLRSFKKNNAACKVSLLEFNKVRARAVSFNYSRIAPESTDQIYIYTERTERNTANEFHQLMIWRKEVLPPTSSLFSNVV